MSKNFKFSNTEKEQIENAITSLEKESSGEIVVFFAKNSSSYLEACWKGVALLGVTPLILISLLSYYWLLPASITPLHLSIGVIAFMTLGGLVPLSIPKTRLSLTTNAVINRRVLTKARDMFLQEEIFKTIDRTGVLIYVSKMENRIQILGDKGINEKIEQKDWDYMIGLILNGIKTNKTAEGIVQAIDNCKKLLLENGFIVREDDKDELSNEIRIEK